MSNYIPVYPLWISEGESAFIYDTRAAAEQLNISEREVMQLARSGRLLFKFVAGKFRCSEADIESERHRKLWERKR